MIKKHMRWGWFFVAPYLVGFVVFTLFAILFSAYVSFTSYNIINLPRWVGLENFIEVWTGTEIWQAFRNVFTYAAILEIFQISIGCVLAVLLNQKLRGIGIFRVMYYIPVLTPMVAVSFVWTSMYNPSYGVLNYLFSFVGLGPFKYVFGYNWFEAVASIAAMNVWKGVGYTTIYLLAGLQNISSDVMEAADIDGATGIKKFFKITLPLLTPTIFFLLTIGVINAIQVFDAFYVMQQNTGMETKVIGKMIYDNVFVYGKVGIGAAIGWTSFVFIAILTYIQKVMEKRWVHYA